MCLVTVTANNRWDMREHRAANINALPLKEADDNMY